MGLEKKDRVDFFHEYWLGVLGIDHKSSPGICRFFSSLDDINVYIFRRAQGPYCVKMCYTFGDGRQGFQGELPLTDTQGLCFPRLGDDSYSRFFTIHNGFGKFEHEGIFSYRSLARVQSQLRDLLIRLEKISREEDCFSLGIFPFYGYREPLTYQCFLSDGEIRRHFSSPNILLSEDNLCDTGFDVIERLHPSNHYCSFLAWMENYLHSEEAYHHE